MPSGGRHEVLCRDLASAKESGVSSRKYRSPRYGAHRGTGGTYGAASVRPGRLSSDTANVGYWATLSLNIPDVTRYARSQRSQALGQALGLPATMTLFAFIGVAVTSATIAVFGEAIWDPVALIAASATRP